MEDSDNPIGDLMVPDSIGSYYIGDVLGLRGVGGFGEVHLGTTFDLNEKVAIKVVSFERLETHPKANERFQREIKILKLLNHPHIISLYEVLETTDASFLVMEYAGGGELFDLIVSKGRLGEAQAQRIFRQLLSAVQHCHKMRVTHRDLKPENILLDEVGWKVLSF